MNVLKCYIVEIYSEEPCYPRQEDMSQLLLWEYVKVKYKYNCYGKETITESIFEKDKWEETKRKGYYYG